MEQCHCDTCTCKTSFETSNGFDPMLWGQHMWVTLYMIAFGYPICNKRIRTCSDGRNVIKIRTEYERFFRSLIFVLPCGSCCRHYHDIIRLNGTECSLTKKRFESRYTITNWIHNVHKCVSKALGKPISNIPELYIWEQRYDNYVNSEWNTHGWRSLIFIAWNFPINPNNNTQRIRGYYRFFSSLVHVLPTLSLRNRYNIMFKNTFPTILNRNEQILNRRALSMWIVHVIKSLHKCNLTYFKLCVEIGTLRK